jgi:hypothetical protein
MAAKLLRAFAFSSAPIERPKHERYGSRSLPRKICCLRGCLSSSRHLAVKHAIVSTWKARKIVARLLRFYMFGMSATSFKASFDYDNCWHGERHTTMVFHLR